MHDALNRYDLLHDELDQLEGTGHDVAELRAEFGRLDADDQEALEDLLVRCEQIEPGADWPWQEPTALDEIVRELPAAEARAIDTDRLADRIRGGWIGRIAGNNVGKPVENGDHWTVERLRDYLERAGAYPLRDYIPVLDPMPSEFQLRECWRETTKGRVDGAARDDDIDYAILALHLIERFGRDGLAPQKVGRSWLQLLPFEQTYTAERVAYRNLILGLAPTETASYRNPYREWIGALIRADVYGWINPGNPRAAAVLAYQDAALSHVGNGIYGAMWAAALIAASFTATTPTEAVTESLRHIPGRSRLADAIRSVCALHAEGVSWEDARAEIGRRYGHYSWVHTINNAAVITAGVLWGGGDFAATVGLTVQGGWDTDSNAATSGSVAGVFVGAAELPQHFVQPLRDVTRSALFGFDNSRISELAERTLRLVG